MALQTDLKVYSHNQWYFEEEEQKSAKRVEQLTEMIAEYEETKLDLGLFQEAQYTHAVCPVYDPCASGRTPDASPDVDTMARKDGIKEASERFGITAEKVGLKGCLILHTAGEERDLVIRYNPGTLERVQLQLEGEKEGSFYVSDPATPEDLKEDKYARGGDMMLAHFKITRFDDLDLFVVNVHRDTRAPGACSNTLQRWITTICKSFRWGHEPHPCVSYYEIFWPRARRFWIECL